MFRGDEGIEKNHFPGQWNRATVQHMKPVHKPNGRTFLILIAVLIAAATLAPVAVLAG